MDSQNSLQLAKMRNSSQDARDYAFKMEAVKKNLMPQVDKEKKLRESCEGFESIFIQKMWEQMRATIPESGLLKGREERFWQGMYDQELAKTMAGAGGIGLADMMYEQLSRNLRAASKSTADAVGGQSSGFAADLAPAPLARPATTAADAETPASRQGAPAIAGLYSEAPQPGLAGEQREPVPPQAAAHAASGVSSEAASIAENETDPAIVAVLNELRNAHQAVAPMNGQQASAPAGANLGARPPLSPMHGDQLNPAAGEQLKTAHIGTLGKTVRKPPSGSRNVLPRAMAGPRVPVSQPVNRNLPFTAQETLQAQAQNQIQNTYAAQPVPENSLPGPASSARNSVGVEALNEFAAQQKAAQFAPGAISPAAANADRLKTGG